MQPLQSSPTLPFNLQAVEAAVEATQFARHLHHLPATASTNQLALEAAHAGTPTGVWIADEQTAGRGRGGHTWHSAPGEGLYISALITPPLPLQTALLLSLATGLAAQAAIAETTSLPIDLRWPNDLLLHSKKCGGILVETAASGPALRYAVIGVGINVNHTAFPPDLSLLATSLRLALGHEVPRDLLLAALIRHLDGEIHLLLARAPGLLERFAAASTWVHGKPVHVAEGTGYTGVTCGLDSAGFLLVDGDDGLRHTVLSGGVRAL